MEIRASQPNRILNSQECQLYPGYAGDNLVFIVGAPRSGTTWLQRLLACHPAVRTGQESKLFRWYIAPQLRMWRMETSREVDPKTATGRGGTGLSCYFREDEFLSLLRQYLFSLLTPMVGPLQPGEIFVEKSPSHALCISEINFLLPESRIIHLLRDPREVVASLLAASRSWGSAWAPRDAGKAAELWREHVQTVRAAAKTLSDETFLEIRYEELLNAPQENLQRVMHFLNLEWSEEEIRQAIRKNSANSPAISLIPLYGEVAKREGAFVKEPQGFVRRALAGAWKSDLALFDRLKIWRVCHELMRELSYL